MTTTWQAASIGERARFVFFPDRLRAVWFFGALALAVVVHTVFLAAVQEHEGVRFLSVLPLLAYLSEMGVRLARRSRADRRDD